MKRPTVLKLFGSVMLTGTFMLQTFTMAAVPTSQYAWYKADVGVTTDGSGKVTNWANQVGGASDLNKQVSSPTTETLPRSGGGTADVISLNGSTALWAAKADFGNIDGDRTVVVYARTLTANDGFLFDSAIGDSLTRAQVRSGMWQVGVQPGGAYSNADPDTAPISVKTWQTHIFTYSETNGTTDVSHYIDDTLAGSHNVATDASLSGFILGASGNGNDKLACQIAEVVVYDRILDATERSDATVYLDGRWGDLLDSIPPNQHAWYKSDDGVLTNGAGVVSVWTSHTGPATDLNNPVGDPATRSVARSGGGMVDVIDLKNNAALWASSGIWGSLGGDRTVVIHARATTRNDGFLFDSSTSSGKTRAQVRDDMWQVGVQPGAASWGSADPDTGPLSENAWQTHIFIYGETGGTTDVSHYIDGTLAGSTNIAVDTSLSGFILGANGSGGANLECQVSELIVYTRVLDATERGEVDAYMTNRWSDLIDLPLMYESATVLQSNAVVAPLGIHGVAELVINSTGDYPAFWLSSLKYNLNGTTELGDIEEVRIYDNGSRDTFDSGVATLMASAVPAAGTQTISLVAPITEDQHRFWLAFKMRNTSADGDILDAGITEIAFLGCDAGTQIPTVTEPPESLTVAADALYSFTLRKEGDDGSGNFRIPGLVTTTDDTLIAAFDIRWDGNSISSPDLPGDIDVGIMRSTDGGLSWGPMQVIMDYNEAVLDSEGNGVGDPCILVDRTTGRIWCAALWSFGNNGWNGSGPGLTPEETGQYVLNYSDDDGLTWSEPVSITDQIKDPVWNLYFQGPGKGICTREGILVFPSQYKDAGGTPRSNFIYSDNHGITWNHVAPAMASGVPATTEAQIIELDSGDLLLSMRNHDGSKRRLWRVYSWNHATETIADGTWGSPWFEQDDPTVMGSVERYRSTLDGHPWSGLLFANPDSKTDREKMSIRLSLDEGLTWPYKRKIDDLQAAYSCMTILPDGDIGILYETGEDSSISRLVFARFPIEWLVGNADSDSDQMPDFHEDAVGLNKNSPADAGLDPDVDGLSNLEEYRAQTDHMNPGSVLAAAIETPDGGLQLSWLSVPYVTYRIESATSLTLGDWSTVPGLEALTANATSTTVALPAAAEPSSFYRVVVQ